MADNIQITPGSGDTVAADQVVDGTLGTVKVQVIKVMDGTLDSTNKMRVDGSGYILAKIAPVQLTTIAGNQTLTVSTSVITLTVPGTATHAFITVEAGDIRYWEDGSNPSATTGLYLPAGGSAELTNLANLKFIKASGQPDAAINVSYRKYI